MAGTVKHGDDFVVRRPPTIAVLPTFLFTGTFFADLSVALERRAAPEDFFFGAVEALELSGT
jgi:hypothetical protein